MQTTHSADCWRRRDFGGRGPSSMMRSVAFFDCGGEMSEAGLLAIARAGFAAASRVKPVGIVGLFEYFAETQGLNRDGHIPPRMGHTDTKHTPSLLVLKERTRLLAVNGSLAILEAPCSRSPGDGDLLST